MPLLIISALKPGLLYAIQLIIPNNMNIIIQVRKIDLNNFTGNFAKNQIRRIKQALTKIPKNPIGKKTMVIKNIVIINFTVGLILCQNDFLFMYLSKAFCIITSSPPY